MHSHGPSQSSPSCFALSRHIAFLRLYRALVSALSNLGHRLIFTMLVASWSPTHWPPRLVKHWKSSRVKTSLLRSIGRAFLTWFAPSLSLFVSGGLFRAIGVAWQRRLTRRPSGRAKSRAPLNSSVRPYEKYRRCGWLTTLFCPGACCVSTASAPARTRGL